MKRIGIDITALQSSHKFRGIGSYLHNLISRLPTIAPDYDYFAFIDGGLPIPPSVIEAPLKFVPITKWGTGKLSSMFAYQFSYPLMMARLGLDAFHFPYVPTRFGDASIPSLCPCPLVVTVPDLTPMKFPSTVFTRRSSYHAYRLTLARTKAAAALITLSGNSRQDLERVLHFDARKIFTIPLGVGSEFKPVTDPKVRSRVLSKHGVNQPYVLCVGDMGPSKNLVRLIQAFEIVDRALACEAQLVFCGHRLIEHDARLIASIKDLGLSGRVLLLDFVAIDELAALYSAASLLVLPSLYEGFGLPLVEAMACGTAVAASFAGSIPEVVGDAALLFDPLSVKVIAEAILALLNDSELREALIVKGLRRAEQFSWENTARETAHVYHRVLGD